MQHTLRKYAHGIFHTAHQYSIKKKLKEYGLFPYIEVQKNQTECRNSIHRNKAAMEKARIDEPPLLDGPVKHFDDPSQKRIERETNKKKRKQMQKEHIVKLKSLPKHRQALQKEMSMRCLRNYRDARNFFARSE